MKKVFKSIVKYFKGVKKEVSRIRWTTKGDLFKYSIATVVSMIFLGGFFSIVDILISLLRSNI